MNDFGACESTFGIGIDWSIGFRSSMVKDGKRRRISLVQDTVLVPLQRYNLDLILTSDNPSDSCCSRGLPGDSQPISAL